MDSCSVEVKWVVTTVIVGNVGLPGEHAVRTRCGLSFRGDTPTMEERTDEVDIIFDREKDAKEFAQQWGQYVAVGQGL